MSKADSMADPIVRAAFEQPALQLNPYPKEASNMGTQPNTVGQFTIYWVGYHNGVPLNSLLSYGVDIAIFAFANLINGSDGTPTVQMSGSGSLTQFYTKDQITGYISSLHARGGKALLSLNDNGGQGPVTWGSVNPQQLAANVTAILKDWGFDGVDLDDEDGGDTSGNFSAVISAFRDSLGPAGIISAPIYGGNQSNVNVRANAANLNLLSTMNYAGSGPGICQYVQELNQLVNSNGTNRSIVSAGISSNDAAGGAGTPLAAVKYLKDNCTAKCGITLWGANYVDSAELLAVLFGLTTSKVA